MEWKHNQINVSILHLHYNAVLLKYLGTEELFGLIMTSVFLKSCLWSWLQSCLFQYMFRYMNHRAESSAGCMCC